MSIVGAVVPKPEDPKVSSLSSTTTNKKVVFEAVIPQHVVADRDVIIGKQQFTPPERACGVICCFPCILWSVVLRVICCPIAQNPCGGNACTSLCDDACLMPIVFGTIPKK